MKLRELRIGVRLGAGFAVVLGLLVLSSLASAFLIQQNKASLKAGLSSANLKRELVTEMKSALLQSGIAMRNMLDITTVGAQKKRADEQNGRYAQALGKLVKLPLSDAEKAILARLDAIEKELAPQYQLAVQQAESLNSEGAASVITYFIDPLNVKSVDEIDKLTELQRQATREVLAQSERADRFLMLLLFGITLAAVCIGTLISFRITRGITRPLTHAVKLASTVAAGDLTLKIEHGKGDEIGQLLNALATMNESLSEIIGNVRGTTDSIGGVSRQLASGNQNLAARTQSQASALEETASVMEELATTVRQNAENARQANTLVRSASDVATRGGQVVGDVVRTMNSIKESSRKIADIISVIDGIAFQTNILALNAAVEAARAGEQGRGFAVVASEVRTLAQRSASAAKEIKVLIDDSVAKVDSGSILADDAGTTMNEVVGSVRRVTDIMAEILAASEEQSVGIEQASKAMTEIDRITQSNAMLVEEAASSAREMEERAGRLSDVVGIFKIGTAPLAEPLAIDRASATEPLRIGA